MHAEETLLLVQSVLRTSGTAAGLHPFQAPELPADLGDGYPEAYTPKDEEAPVGVEPVAAAVAKVCLLSNHV